MISKKAVDTFLNKKFESYNWLKGVPRKELEKEVSSLSSNYKFKTTPYTHQLVGVLLGLTNNNFLYFMEMGTGKSKIILDTLSIRRSEWKKALVLSPNVSTVATFGEQVRKHSYLTCTELVGPIENRWELLKQNTDIYALNYTGLLLMLTDSIKGKWKINDKRANMFSKLFDVVVYDESHNVKNHESLSFKVCSRLSKEAKFKFALTGTPLNRDPISLWAQFYLVDRGETLGETLGMYREAYFKTKLSYWRGREKRPITEYIFKDKLTDSLNLRVSSKSIRYSEEEANDLPDKVVVDIPVPFSMESKDFYIQAIQGIISAGRDLTQIKNSFHKLRQICSGYLQYINDDGEKVDIEFDDQIKTNIFIDLIKDIPDKRKVVVFLNYIKSGDLLCERLQKEKIKFLRLYGKTKDKVKVKSDFIKKDYRILVANTDSASEGIDGLQDVANYVIYYELPVSSIDYSQSMKRVHRTGQKNRVFIYRLITKNSIEEKIDKYLKEGGDIFKSLIEDKEILK